MIKVLSFFLHPIALTVLGLAALFGLVFFGGRALREQQLIALTDWQLALIFSAAASLLLLLILWIRYRALKRQSKLEREKREQGLEDASGVERDRRDEMRAMLSQFDEALEALKSTRLGKRAQEALPWYVIVGPPSSGKTTMLGKSGLNFPYTVQGKRWFRGVSGTRNCDWWFTDQGILLDTAGRYTTEADDRREWLALLGMLRRARKNKPINGAVVTISMEDLLGDSEEKIVEHAGRIRERLADLTSRLELVFPIYLVFTKCDLLPGFVETFGSLDREERAQVWGCTLARRRSADESVEQIFEKEFSSLYDRLCSNRLSRMAGDRSVGETEKVYSFPVEFAVAKSRLAEFVRLLVQPNPYHEGSDLRGFYFSSGTQNTAPIEQVLEAADESASEAPQQNRPEVEPRSYFVDHLFTKVVFPDHGLARTSSRAALRKKLISWSAIVGSIAATLALSVLLIRNYGQNLDLIATSGTAVRDVVLRTESLQKPLRGAQKEYVDRLRDVFVRLDEGQSSPGTYLLGQGDNLYPRVRTAYAGVVKKILLEPLQDELEPALEAAAKIGAPGGGPVEAMGPGEPSPAESDFRQVTADAIQLSQQLTLYRMIGFGPAEEDPLHMPPDAKTIRGILDSLGKWDEDWRQYGDLSRLISRKGPEEDRDWAIELKESLVTGVEIALERVELEIPFELAEKAIGEEFKTLEDLLPDVNLDGIQRDQIKIRLETPEQLRDARTRLDVLLDMMPGTEEHIRRWRTRLQDQLFDRYVNKWRDVLEDLRPVEARNLEDAIKNLKRHTGADSVYKKVYLLVRANLAELSGSVPAGESDLAEELSELRAAGADAIWLTNALEDLRHVEDVVADFTRQPNDDTQRVLRDMRENEGRRIWAVWDTLNAKLNDALLKVDSNAESALRLHMRTALQNLAESVRSALMREVVTEVTTYWEKNVGREFRELRKLYPFAPIGPMVADIPDNEFIRMFSPDGQYENFYKELEKFTEKRLDTGEYLLKFTERFQTDRGEVEKIQRSLFSVSEQPLSVGFRVAMENDADISRTQLAFGSQHVSTDAMRPETLKQRTWSWSRDDIGASVLVTVQTADPQDFSRKPEEPEATSWSLFRLIESAETVGDGANAVECEWVFEYQPKAGDTQQRTAQLTLTAVFDPMVEAENPFRPGFFRGFEFAEEIFNPYEPRENRMEERSEDGQSER